SMAGGTHEKWTLELVAYLKQRWQGQVLESAPLFEDRLDRYVAIGLNATHTLQTSAEMPPPEDDDAELLARSVSNRLLSCTFKKPGMMSIGNLISFRKADMPVNRRALGIVDTLVIEKDEGKLSFGLRLLTPQAIAVNYFAGTGISAAHPDHPERFKKALIYQVKEPEPKSYLITDTFLLKSGDAINLFVDHEEFNVTLKNKKNIGLGYWQFECAKTSDKKKMDSH
ncbi:MAG: hypothetical protein PHU14_12375, partial [Methylovulum sp.]|nr:hypothetical protein [Methylovulum sp.]